MLGYKPDALRDKKKRGGRIDGPGTGTSDSIQKDVKDGTYIMPADSTEAIGEQALAEMGNDVPVNVSNGEYEMPPEQVHAVGVQALDQMKNATHEPVQKPQQGLGYDPELFFADGGVVDEEKRKKPNVFSQLAPQAPTPTPMAPQQQPAGVVEQAMDATQRRMNDPILKNAPQAPAAEQATLGSVANAGPGTANVGPFKVSHLPDYSQGGQGGGTGGMRALMGDAYPGWDENGQATGIFKRGRQAASMAEQDVIDSFKRGDYAHAAGKTLTGALATGIGYGDDIYQENIKPLVGGVASGIADFFRGATGSQSGAQQRAQTQEVAPAASPVLEQTTADPAGAAPVGEQAVKPETYASGIQKPTMVDGVPTFTNEHVRGFDPATANTISSQAMMAPSASTQQALSGAMQAAAARGDFAAINQSLARQGQQPIGGAQMQGGGGTRFNVIRDTSRDDALRRKLVSAATTPHRGAQNGQLTRGQIDAIRGLMSDERSDQTKRDTTAQSNQTTLQAEAMRQGGQQARNQLDERKFAAEQAALGYQTRAADRLEKAYERFEAAETPEDRGAAAELIRTLSGKEQAPRFAVAAGGQGFNADGTPYTLPAQVYNQQTGEFVNPQQQQLNAPQKGEVRNGYRFIGGDPASQKSWEKI